MGYCENCGCKSYNGRCTNCHEELFILDQYRELDMDLPDGNSDFMKTVNQQLNEIKENNGKSRRKYTH